MDDVTRWPLDPSVEVLEEQERQLVLDSADVAVLHDLGERMYADALGRQLPLAIQLRLGDRLAYAAALPGSAALHDDWAARKARVVHLFDCSSLLVRRTHERDGIDFQAKHGLRADMYAAFGGAFPLRVPNVGFVGSAAVSGLPQLEDHLFVVSTLQAFLRRS